MTNLTDRFAGIRRDYSPADVERLRGSVDDRAHARPARRRAPVAAPARAAVRPRPRRAHRQPGDAAGQGRARGDLSVRLAGRRRRQQRRRDVSRPVALSRRRRSPRSSAASTRRFQRADQIARLEGDTSTYWFAPIVADAEAGFGGPLNAFELMKAMIEAGAAGVHFEDQLASEKKCGHLGGKVLVPTQTFIRTLNAARLAADVSRRRRRSSSPAPTPIRRRSSPATSTSATMPWISGERTSEGFYPPQPGQHHSVEHAIARGLAYAPYADLVWWETSTPDLGEAREFAEEVHRHFIRASCSPTTARRRSTGAPSSIRGPSPRFQEDARGDGLPLPVRHARRLPRPQPVDVRARRRLRRARHGRLFRAAGARVRGRRDAGSPRFATSARSARPISTRWRWRSRPGKSATVAMAGSTETEQFGRANVAANAA